MNKRRFPELPSLTCPNLDCICDDILVAKLHVYRLSRYLRNRNQRRNSGMSYSIWEEVLSGVSQVLILSPLLFIIFLHELFFEHNSHYFNNYADRTTLYVIDDNTTKLWTSLTQRRIQDCCNIQDGAPWG